MGGQIIEIGLGIASVVAGTAPMWGRTKAGQRVLRGVESGLEHASDAMYKAEATAKRFSGRGKGRTPSAR